MCGFPGSRVVNFWKLKLHNMLIKIGKKSKLPGNFFKVFPKVSSPYSRREETGNFSGWQPCFFGPGV